MLSTRTANVVGSAGTLCPAPIVSATESFTRCDISSLRAMVARASKRCSSLSMHRRSLYGAIFGAAWAARAIRLFMASAAISTRMEAAICFASAVNRRGYGLRRNGSFRFCQLRIDGGDEGTLHLDHLPSPAEAKLIRQVMAIRKRRKPSGEARPDFDPRYTPDNRPF